VVSNMIKAGLQTIELELPHRALTGHLEKLINIQSYTTYFKQASSCALQCTLVGLVDITFITVLSLSNSFYYLIKI